MKKKRFFLILLFLFVSLVGFTKERKSEQLGFFGGVKSYQDDDLKRLRAFLTEAQAVLDSSVSFDEDLLAEFQWLTKIFNRITKVSPLTAAQFFEISEKLILQEQAATEKAAVAFRKRRTADRIAGNLAAAAVGSAVAGAIFFGAATVPYADYLNAYETTEAVAARKKTTAVLAPAGILTAVAGGLLLSSAVVYGSGGRREIDRARRKVFEERHKGSYVQRGGF